MLKFEITGVGFTKPLIIDLCPYPSLQVNGAGSFTLEASIDGETFYPIASIKAASGETVSQIVENGIYYPIVTGVPISYRLNITNTTNLEVIFMG